jgi:general secretion pathway protein C
MGTRRRWIAVLGGVALGTFAAYLYWPHLYGLLEQRASQPAQQAAQTAAPPTEAPAVVPEPIMGDPKLAILGTDSSTSEKPLALVLVGTIPGRNVSEGTAMIGTDARNAQTYLAGAILHNSARLTEIHRDRVVLTRGNRRAVLYMQGRGAGEGKGAPDPMLMVGGASPQTLVVASIPPASIDSVSDYVRAVPVYDGDVIRGFQVFPGSRKSAFTKWGLQPGDVLTSLDGAALVDPDQVQLLLGTLSEGAALSASVRRSDGSIAQLSLNGADIARPATTVAAQMSPP